MSSLVSQALPPPLTYSNASSSSTPSVGATAEGRHELSPFLLSSLPGGVQHYVPALKGGLGGSSNGVGGGHGGEDGDRRERASARPAHLRSPTLSGPASEPSGGLGEF
jgi:hypothetical protein